MNLTILQEIGLTRKEAELYTALLALGESPVADLIHKTKTHPQIVYSTLASLVEQGLVIEDFRRHRRYVRAENPAILKRMEQRRQAALDRLIPKLNALQKAPDEPVVRVSRGNEAVRADRERAVEVLKSGETLYILGGGAQGRFIEVMKEQHVELERRRVKKGIHKRMLAYANQRELIARTNPITDLAETRFLPEDYATPTSLFVYGPFSSTVIWLPEPIVVTVESQIVADSNRDYFTALWRVAKK